MCHAIRLKMIGVGFWVRRAATSPSSPNYYHYTENEMQHSVKIALLTLTLLLLTAPLHGSSFILKGVLLDPQFFGRSSCTAELLEDGSTFEVSFGKPFTIPLTNDTAWNLCIQSDSIEQCYTISRTSPTDSIIADSLTNNNKIEVFSSFITNDNPRATSPAATNTDTTADSLPSTAVEVTDLVTQLRPVVIQVRKRPKRRMGQSTVSSKAIERQPGLAEADVIKAIQALPGVVASSDFSSKIYVRGGGADQNLFLFDNGVVYSPVHFFGLFSTFLVDGVESVDFYKGGFPPRYGNRLSSVVDIKSRKGGKEKSDTLSLKGSAQITTFASTLSLEGSKNAVRFNVSGRSTYIKEALAALREANLTDIDIDYRFYDLQGNLSIDLPNNQLLTISGYTGQDNLIFPPLATNWGNRVLPLNYTWNISEDWFFSASLSYSNFNQEFGIENLQTFTNSITSIEAKPLLVYRGLENHILSAGIESQRFEIIFGSNSELIDFEYKSVKKFFLNSLFLEDKLTLGKFDIAAGLRSNYFPPLQSASAEPRLSCTYSFTPERRLDAHVGYYQQFINSIVFGDMETLNEFYYPATKEKTQDIPPSSSLLFAVGYSQDNLFSGYDLIVEGYYKTLSNLLVFDPSSKPDSVQNNPNAGIGDFFSTGEGYSMGAEISVRRNSGIFSGGLSYALGYSIQKETARTFRAKWDIPHAFKVDGGITWRDPADECLWKSRTWFLRSSLQIKYSTGLPYTEITGYLPTHFIDQGDGAAPGPVPSLSGNIATPLAGRNRSRYPSYGRVDLKLIDWGKPEVWNFNWTLLNILNRENVFIYIFNNDVQPPKRVTIPQFPFFPILFSYKRYF